MEFFAKTKMCRFYILGTCAKGPECPFAHDKRELRAMPDLRCTKICNTLLQTGECKDKACTYAHNEKELRSTGTFQRTKICRNLQFGRCPRGDKCNFAHSAAEMQSPFSHSRCGANVSGQPAAEIQSYFAHSSDGKDVFEHSAADIPFPNFMKPFKQGLGSASDGDDRSTRVSGSSDSNSSDHGSQTASLNGVFEPAYVHVEARTPKDELGKRLELSQLMGLQKAIVERDQGDLTRLVDDFMQNQGCSLFDSDSSLRNYSPLIDEAIAGNAKRRYAVLSA